MNKKIPVVMQQGLEASFTFFRYGLLRDLYPGPVTGASRIGLLVSFRPFNSEGHSASALLPGFHHVPPGSLEIALKRTHPRQRFMIVIGSILCDGYGYVKRDIS
jgi:hypothetical protein